tara:strand:+ start:2326 stop:5088 length:2763 start_codon:yes stop_codon:yes gene_type:complete
MGSAPVLAQSQSAYYEEGVQAYAQGEYAEAYIHLKNALQADPNMVPARVLLAKVHFNAGNVHGAVKESEEALLLGADINLILPVYGPALVVLRQTDKLFALEKVADEFTPESQFEWALLKGQGHLQRSEPDLARREFERAARLFPNDVRSNNTLAALYIDNGMLAEAAALLEKSLLLDADNIKTLELSAELAIAEEHYDKALRLLARAHEQDSADLRVLRSLARVHLLLGNTQEMENYLELILEQSPDDPAATLLTAITSIDRGDTEIGDAMLSELSQKLSRVDALRLQSTDGMLFIQAASDYVRGSDRSAIDLFNTYLARNPSDLAAISMLVDLYLRNNESRRANTLLSDSREFITDDLALSLQLLHLYIQNGSVLNARELLEDLRESTGNNPFVTILEAELERSQGKSEEALAVLEQRDFSVDPPLSYGLLRGALLLDIGRLDEAERVAKQLQSSNPDALRVQNFAAVIYLRAGRLKDAERAIDAALKLSGSDVEARFNQAMLLKQRGKRDDAARLLNEILAGRPSHTKSILLMAQILYEQGRSDEAIDWSEKVYVYDKTSTLPDEFRLGVYAQQGDWEDALSAALALSKADPLSEVYLVQLAEIYLKLGDMEVAQRPLRRLFVLWKDDAAKLRRLADMQISAQNPAEARMTLEAALKLEPESFDTRLSLVRLDLAQSRYAPARERLDGLSELIGDNADVSFLYGDLALAEGDKETAREHYLQSLTLNPAQSAAVLRLYELSLEGVGAEAFTATLEKILQQASLPPWQVRLLADSYLVQGKPERAQRYYESLLEHPDYGSDAGVLNNLANIYAEEDLDKALATAMQALESGGEKNYALLDTVGWILTRLGREEQALPYLRKAYSINSRNPEIRYHTGVALLGLKREAEALSELRAALASDAEYPGRDDAETLLNSLAQ